MNWRIIQRLAEAAMILGSLLIFAYAIAAYAHQGIG